MLASGPTVQRLRVHAPGAGSAEAARAQRVARQWLEDLAPTRYGLQAQAIVVVRQVQTRLPALVPHADTAAAGVAAVAGRRGRGLAAGDGPRRAW